MQNNCTLKTCCNRAFIGQIRKRTVIALWLAIDIIDYVIASLATGTTRAWAWLGALCAKMAEYDGGFDLNALLAVAECISRTEARFEHFTYCCGAYFTLRTSVSVHLSVALHFNFVELCLCVRHVHANCLTITISNWSHGLECDSGWITLVSSL